MTSPLCSCSGRISGSFRRKLTQACPWMHNLTMFKADRIWIQVRRHFRPNVQSSGQAVFRRIVRQYYSYSKAGSYRPNSNRVSARIVTGERWVHTGGRWRRKTSLMGARSKGRPSGLAVEYLVACLAYQWAIWQKSRPTIHHGRYQHIPTKWEQFLCDVLLRLGVGDCRRHSERHSAAKRI